MTNNIHMLNRAERLRMYCSNGRSRILRDPETLDAWPPLFIYPLPRDYKIGIFGLQKAGNTWLLSLLSTICQLEPFFNLTDERQHGRAGVVSTHDPLSEAIFQRDDFYFGVCLIRDPRDMIASYYYYMQSVSFQTDVPRAKYADWDTFYFDWFLARLVPAYNWHGFWDEYSSFGLPVLRYERLVSNPVVELLRLFDRWSLPVDPNLVEEVVADHQFESMRQHGRQIGHTKIDASHFRRGVVGSGVEELPARIRADVEDRFSHLLKRWGYV